jgi:hypothetical protein
MDQREYKLRKLSYVCSHDGAVRGLWKRTWRCRGGGGEAAHPRQVLEFFIRGRRRHPPVEVLVMFSFVGGLGVSSPSSM